MVQRANCRLASLMAAAVLCCGALLHAQVQVGNDVQLSVSGDISTAYAGSFANEGPSSHGLLFGGIGDLSGSYYSPQFLTFNVSPFYNQSRNSSTLSSINDSSGVIARAGIFGGSQFPGFITYSRTYNNESDFAIPGIANFKTNGNNQALGVGWSFNFKDLPSLSVGYQQGSSDNTLFGAQTDSITDFHSLFGNANYSVAGFHMNGGVHYSSSDSQFPQIVAGQPIEKASADTTTYTFGVSRTIVLDGSTWANFTRNVAGSDSQSLSSSQTADIISTGVALKPTNRFSTQFSADYNDSVAGTLLQQVNSAGILTPVAIPAGDSHSWGVFGQGQYKVFTGLYLAGSVSHREQLFLGTNYDSTGYSASANFGHKLLGGQFTTGETVTYYTQSSNGQSMLGFLSNASYMRSIGRWNVSGSANYSQNAQTLLVAVTTSGMGYSTSVGRRFGRLNWNGSASGSKSLLTGIQGTTNFTQNYSTGLSGRWLSGSVGYAKSSGTGILTSSGIAVLPPGVPPPFLPTSVLFGGTSYSAGLGSSPTRALTVNATWSRSISNTNNGSVLSNNKTEQINSYLIYKFRKLYFNAGYSRLLQGFSASGLPPATVSSYYFGISRWFKFL